jgi:pterin-4a-carbinolamine dehydratase
VADHDSVPPLVFISYRRTDSQQAALGLYIQLRARIGPGSVFMDRTGISSGEIWPERLREAIGQATVLLAVIGPGWLTSADEYGRRRIDSPTDWVGKELTAAINSNKLLIPILLGPSAGMPPAEALPPPLASLASFQAYSLREDHWDADLNELIQLLVQRFGFKEGDQRVRLPQPQVQIQPLTQSELDQGLAALSGWEQVESLIPGDYPKSRQELRKVYVFKSFRSAVTFMHSAIDPVSQLQHHPRWENQWRTVTVYLST